MSVTSNHLQLPAKHLGVLVSKLLRRYMDWRDHPGKLRLVGWIRSMLGNRRMVVACRSGLLMAVDERDYVQRTIFTEGEWEPEVGELLSQELKKGDVFYDIGANVGYFTCLATKQNGISVYSFEPDPLSMSVLKLNLGLNKIPAQTATCLQFAIGSRNERRRFSRFPVNNVGKSGFDIDDRVEETFEVECRTLDSLISDDSLPRPSVIKIDTEGWERHVLAGATNLFENHRPRLVVFEAVCDSQCNIADSELICFLSSRDYKICHLPRPSGVIEGNENFAAFLQ